MADADAFFGQELPALQQWSFTEDDARRIEQPVLAVLGAGPRRRSGRGSSSSASWLPNAKTFELPGATHLLHLENPSGMAEAMASFYARHSVAA